jgi:glycosyltransferase involved in cell wall biosynthesis
VRELSRILLLGVGPLPGDPGDRLFATGLRVQQLADVLSRAGHHVTLVASTFGQTATPTPALPGGASEPRGMQGAIRALGEMVEVRRLAYHPVAALETVSTMVFAGGYDAIVSTTDIMNDLSARLDTDHPRWMDFFGDPFAEKQMQAATASHDGSLRMQWPLYLNALSIGDRFSVCSQSQAMALAGQLAFTGRLNGATDGEPLIHVLEASSRAMLDVERRLGPQSRPVSMSVPSEAFKVLWSGGYNTWADVETLFRGLELAMERIPRLHFLSTGGAIAGHDSTTAGRFSEMVASSPHRDRYHFLGWVQTRDIPYLYRLADVAVNADKRCYEGELGTRNRLIDWTLFEVPIVTTATCDLALELASRELVSLVQTGSPESLAEGLEGIFHSKEQAKTRAHQAKAWFESSHNEAESFASLTQWAATPKRAGDHEWLAANRPADSRPGQAATSRERPVESRTASLVSRRHHEYFRLEGRSRQGFLGRVVRKVFGRK